MFERSGKPEMQFWREGKGGGGQAYAARAGFRLSTSHPGISQPALSRKTTTVGDPKKGRGNAG